MKLGQLLRIIDCRETTIVLSALDGVKEGYMEYQKGKYDEGIFWMIRKCDIIKITPKNNKLHIKIDTKGQGLPM